MSFKDEIKKQQESREKWIANKTNEREVVSSLADNGIAMITSDPEYYAKYLSLQADNFSLSPNNLAIVMETNPEATLVAQADTWVKRGRKVKPSQYDNGIKVFVPMPEKERKRRNIKEVYSVIGMVYDISQTTGSDYMPSKMIAHDSDFMDKAVGTFVTVSKAPIVFDTDLPVAAEYNIETRSLEINPNAPVIDVFRALCSETVYANRHRGGSRYDKSWYLLEAESIAYLLNRHFLGDTALPDTTGVLQFYEGKSIADRLQSLQYNLKSYNDMRNAIRKALTK